MIFTNKKNRLLTGMFFLFLLMSFSAAVGQIKVSGIVTDAMTKEPLSFANIAVEGSTTGTTTDPDGFYEITVPENSKLVFTYIGYNKEKVTANRSEINVALAPDMKSLEEIVVVGYGTVKKEDLTGSVSMVNTDEVVNTKQATIDKALQGKAAGVYVANTSGRPGSNPTIKIRGISSINSSTEPLIVIDGIPFGNLNSLNPKDVESIQVLKDASATAIYGARGANGVIIVTTKKGVKGEPKFTFTADYILTELANPIEVMNANQYSSFMREAWQNYAGDLDGTIYQKVYSDSARRSNNNYNTDTDFLDAITRKGRGQNYYLSGQGGSENGSYFVSGNYYEETGILTNTNFDRFTIKANSELKLNDWFTLGENITFSRQTGEEESHYTNFNTWRNALTSSPLMPLYNADYVPGQIPLNYYGGPVDSLTGSNDRTNPLAEERYNENMYDQTTVLSIVYAKLKLFKGLEYSVNFGFDFDHYGTKKWSPSYELGNIGGREKNNRLVRSSSKTEKYLINNILNYNLELDNHTFQAMVGWEREAVNGNYLEATASDFEFFEFNIIDQAQTHVDMSGRKTKRRYESFLGRINYNYASKYFLTANFRQDKSGNKFGPQNRVGNFPSLAAAWKVNEDLFQNVDWINMLKLRGGWGVTGNSNLPDFQWAATLDPPGNSRYNFGADQKLYLAYVATSKQPNAFLQWEETEMTNIGIDLSAFRNRLEVTAEYFNKNQDQMLFEIPISTVFGKKYFYGSPELGKVGVWANVGKIRNSGFEFNMSYKKFEGDFNYTLSGNVSFVKNEVVSIPEPIVFASGLTTEGHSIGSFYGYIADGILQEDDFLQDENGELITDNKGNYTILHAEQEAGTAPGDIKYKDLNADGIIDATDRTIIGKPFPDLIYGFNIDILYKGFDLNLFLQGMQNVDVFNQLASVTQIGTDPEAKDQNKVVDVLDYWTPENQSNTHTRANVDDPNNNARISSWFIEDASFLRVKTLQFGYSLPSNLLSNLNVDKFRVYVNFNNLYTFTKYSGFDPEVANSDPLLSGVDSGVYPVPRTYTFGIQLDF